MKTSLAKAIVAISVAALLQMNPGWGQDAAVGELIRDINLKLSHSSIQGIDQDGLVVIKAPSETLRFNIQEMSINYNGLNDDDRVRIFCNYCIGRYDGRYLEGTAHRESFLCGSKQDAIDAITAFNRLKKIYVDRDARWKAFDRTIATGDSSLPYRSVAEAIDYVNRNLVVSMIMSVNGKGRMLINTPDDIYEVDLEKAEFGFNELNWEPKLRIYGEWSLVILRKDTTKEVPRESFEIASRERARDVIKAMYFIKSAFTGTDAATILSLRNVTGTRAKSYSTISQAIDYINDRLEYSILLNIDDKGTATVNSMDKIFMFDVGLTTFSQNRETNFLRNIFNIFARGGREAVVVESHDGIERYEAGRRDEQMDEQPFQCKSEADVADVIKAFEFIKSKLSAGKGA
ncbi:MAG: hypothetical protein HYX75_18920 [Acidobacteria bacterium]|nr:hypothetical protein [Acidobacteriota bacterium]